MEHFILAKLKFSGQHLGLI